MGKFKKQSLTVYKSLDVRLYFKMGFVSSIKVTKTPISTFPRNELPPLLCFNLADFNYLNGLLELLSI